MASSSSSSHSTPASSSGRSYSYDVFVSFRGEDTRKTFVDHLYTALIARLIRTYKDDEALPRGDSISPSLLKAIQESRTAVIVFSKNYADSSWCLDELAYIMKCRDEIGLIVMPIFYDVDPSEVRHQKRKFGEAFAKQEAKNFMNADLWRKALIEASNIAGWEVKNVAGGYESKVIKEIVDKIQDRLFPLDSDVDEELVGMRVRLQDLISRLEIGSGGVRMVGIWGIGGSGKTTLAFSVYTEISPHFQGHCFIANIREQSKHGLETLQQKLLSTVLKTEVEVQSVEEGKFIIKSRLCNSKVLVLLDDVDDLDQLQALAGSHKWFGVGSRIIITTRDEHVLTAHGVDNISPVKLLSDEEAMRLFYKHAYNKTEPKTDYETLSLSFISYADRLPLALKVLGSLVCGRDENQWRSALAMLKEIPNIKIMDILKISYDGLESNLQKLFLDIACFFRWESADITDEAMEILDACGFHPVIGIEMLKQKALITIVDGRFDMHDLVQEMGHYIVRGEHPNNPENHSRVWRSEEIRDMSFGDLTMENHKIEAIRSDVDFPLSGKLISNMKKLRWLGMEPWDGFFDDEGPTFLSNELRYFCWVRYPASSFPDSFQPLNLVVLKLSGNLHKELWNGNKRAPHLKVLELRCMWNLLSTPDFGKLPCLLKVTLYECEELEEIHPSLGNHTSLEYVSVSSCPKLGRFPTIVQMKKLKTLKIKGCPLILDFPEIIEKMESLEKLSLSRYCSIRDGQGWSLKNLNLSSLHNLNLSSSRKLNLGSWGLELPRILQNLNLSSLRKLNLGSWGLEDGEIPSEIGELPNLEELDLNDNSFSRLDFSLLQLTRLKLLRLTDCKTLVELPELPSSVAILEADYCDSLTAIGNHHTDFNWLCKVSLLEGGTITDGSRLLQVMLQGKAIENHCMVVRLQGLEISEKFYPPLRNRGTCKLQLPEKWCNDYCGFLMCAVSKHDYMTCVSIRMTHITSDSMCMDYQHDDEVWEESVGDERTWVGYVPFSSLRHTSWMDETSNALLFSLNELVEFRGGFGVRLVKANKSGSDQSLRGKLADSEFSIYAPQFEIDHDTESSLSICLTYSLVSAGLTIT